MFWFILALGAAFRFFLLGIKPPHFDEGINGWFVDQLVKEGFYRYDPTNYHGPLHFYILFLFESVLGRNLWALRLPVVLGSITSIWLALKYDAVVPRQMARLAALTMAISPGFVFYGRYSIHEVWLLLFSLMFVLGLLGLWRHGTTNYLWLFGIGISGMILTKETYIIHLGCAVLAVPVLMLVNWLPGKLHSVISKPRWLQRCFVSPIPDDSDCAEQQWSWLDAAVVCGVGAGAIIFFYSGTFFHLSGVKGLYQTFHAWFETGSSGHGHEKPWYYWSLLILRYEWWAVIGLMFCPFVYRLPWVSVRYLAIMGAGVFAAYSIVHYKTPWCIISVVWPLLFIFGAFIVSTGRRIAVLTLSIVLVSSSLSTVTLNYFRCTTFADYSWDSDRSWLSNLSTFFSSEPYVYVQTYNDIYKLTTPLLELAHRDPRAYHLVGHIIRPSPYPLPWILGDFAHVGYYEHETLPPTMDADFLLVQDDKVREVESKLYDSYYVQSLTIRPYQDPSKLYLRAAVFKRFFPDQLPVSFPHQ